MDTKEIDIDAVSKAIEVDAGESLPDLRQALIEANQIMKDLNQMRSSAG